MDGDFKALGVCISAMVIIAALYAAFGQ